MSTSMCRPSAWPGRLAEPGDDVEDAVGDAGLGGQLGEAERAERGELGRLDDQRCCRRPATGPTFQAAIIIGKFHGRTAPTTPIGSRMIMPSASGPVGAIESYSLSAASAYQRNVLIVSGRSASRQSVIGLPASSESSIASSSAFASIRSARRSSTALRSAGERRDQRPSSNARRAARTATSMSAASPAATSARSRPVAGFSVANRSPLSAGRKAPSMKASVRKVGVVAIAMPLLPSP